MAGLVGAGRSELAQTVFGVDPALGGEITLEGVPVQLGSARESIRAGIYLAPEDRKKTGLDTRVRTSARTSRWLP